MRRRQLIVSLLVVLSVALGGVVECSPRVAMTATQRHGASLYGRMCAVCHGRLGEGYAADQAPALAHPGFLASVTDDFLRDAIANGRASTTMSAWGIERGGPLKRDDIEGVVAFLRTWEGGPRAALDEQPTGGDASRGAIVYARECAECHGARGVGGPNIHIGDPKLLARASNGFLRYAIRRGRPKTAMKSYARLGDEGIEDLVALLRSWQVAPSPAAALTAPPPPPARPPPIPLGPVPLNPKGPEPIGFRPTPATTPADVIKAQLNRGARMGFLDARAPSDYLNEHIAGAVSVPFYDPDEYIAALPKDAWLVCYCACPHAESGQLAARLAAKGFTKVTVLDEGLNVWKTRNYGTSTGIEP